MTMCAVYILTNKNQSVLYTGVTNDLEKRLYEHKTKVYPNSFSARYRTYDLVYFEEFNRIDDAISREKQIKAGSRRKKIDLINSINPDWIDLAPHIFGYSPD